MYTHIVHGTSVYTYRAAAGGRLQMRPYLRKICFGFWWEQDQGILLSINIYPTLKKKRKILLKRLQNKIKREESQKSWEERRESTVSTTVHSVGSVWSFSQSLIRARTESSAGPRGKHISEDNPSSVPVLASPLYIATVPVSLFSFFHAIELSKILSQI